MNRRTIKFRVWDKKESRFLDQDEKLGLVLIDLSGNVRFAEWSVGNGDNSADSVFKHLDNQERYIIQRFTGATDKNDKEIYDGDIVKVRRCHTITREVSKNTFTADLIEDGEEVGYVFWPWCQYKWLVSYEHIRYDDFDDFNGIDHRHEIIGTICENPELVKYQW